MLLPTVAWRIELRGRVQGVGFRPFVLRLALRMGVRGWVRNSGGRVEIHAEASEQVLNAFVSALCAEAPPLAQPEVTTVGVTDPEGHAAFVIRASDGDGSQAPGVIPPDHFVCVECLAEMADPTARRYRYPFTNCTQCGPRYTIIDALPYDRPRTAMAAFPLCVACQSEYDDPADRRYHAQPLACPVCGPVLEFRSPNSPPVAGNEAALRACVEALRKGQIVAVKGIGGYHLFCDARSELAVLRLRDRKHRPDKPLAVMIPEGFEPLPGVDGAEHALLGSPLRPIVLVAKATLPGLCDAITPDLSEVGLMRPYSPLHHLLLAEFEGPLVATSANLGGEPVLTQSHAVEDRLHAIADAFLHHNRPILRPADDSVYRHWAGKLRPLRLGRGVAPIELILPRPVARPTLALGADLKNTVALAVADRVIVSPHLGDLAAPRSLEVFGQVIADLGRLYQVEPEWVVCDAHPAYFSSRWASEQGRAVQRVFHHAAHASAVVGEFGVEEPMLVFTWDGLGYGEDGTLWGGEALLGSPGDWRRVASLRPFRLIGGEKASRDPWRCALALCLDAGIDWHDTPPGAALARQAWVRGINTPVTTSIGRLFDAAAALTGLAQTQTYEGHAAMRLEAEATPGQTAMALPLYADGSLWRADWSPLLPMLMDAGRSPAERAGIFHESLAGLIVDQAQRIRQSHAFGPVGLTGGVFQNRKLTEAVACRLKAAGLTVLLPERLPVNDAALSFGQVVESLYLPA